MDRLDSGTWCDECGELGWEGVCPACVAFNEAHQPQLVEAA